MDNNETVTLNLDELYDLRVSMVSDYLSTRADLGRINLVTAGGPMEYFWLTEFLNQVAPWIHACGTLIRDLKTGRHPDREAVDELRLAGLI